MSDTFNNPTTGLQDPANNAYTATPHAEDPLPIYSRAIYVGTAGDLTCKMMKDAADVTFVGVPAGTILPIRVSHIRASSTADDIVVLY